MARLFVSYARDDAAAAAKVVAALQRAGHDVWWDALIAGGARYSQLIDEALQAADAVVVLWSRRAVESDWVRDEAVQGRDRHRLVPLSLDGSPPPLGFRQIQTIDFSHWHGRNNAHQFLELEQAIATALGEEEPVRRRAPAADVTRRRMLIGGTAGAVAVAGAGLIGWREGLFGGAANARSIAVLPFKNVSSDRSQDYLSDGLTEEIRSALSLNSGLMVLAGTSSNAVREDNKGAVDIAGKLGVAYLLEGTVQRAGDIVQVSTNLTNGKTGFSEWSQQVERRLDDIFAFESEIARTVSTALSVRMATDTPVPGGTRNVRAYEAYLRGKALYNLAKDEPTDREARANYEIAIAADPNFALAHAALSRSLASLAGEYAKANDLKMLYDGAIAEARKAIALAPTLAAGHLALGYALFAGRLDVQGARPSYEKAYQYGRGDADVILLYAVYIVRSRRFEEARAAIDRALALDPLNPRTHRAAGTIAYAARRYADAVAEYRRGLDLNPKMGNAHALMGDCLMELGKIDDARAAYAAEPNDFFRLRGQAILEHRAGNEPAAQAAFQHLVKDVGDSAVYQQAEVLAQWGKTDEALAKLLRARAVGDSGLSYIATDPLLDPIAGDPRFKRFVKEIGFA